MDEPLQELETELKRLRPRAPSAALLRRLERDLADERSSSSATVAAADDPGRRRYSSATNWTAWKWSGWPAIAAAAAVALVAVGVFSLRRDEVPSAGPGAAAPAIAQAQPVAVADYEPVSAANVLYDLRDEGLVTLDGNTPAHQVRYRYLDTYTWKSPQNNASVKWSFPRDEIRVVPASYR